MNRWANVDKNELKAAKLRLDVGELVAGKPCDVVLRVACDLVAHVIAVMSETPDEAQKLTERAALGIREAIRQNWDSTRPARAEAMKAGNHEGKITGKASQDL